MILFQNNISNPPQHTFSVEFPSLDALSIRTRLNHPIGQPSNHFCPHKYPMGLEWKSAIALIKEQWMRTREQTRRQMRLN
ncbi:hypothetical protein TNIN_31391 [Trichonephila inaurata madagascariensis]|uniref:Uncharacterized protein n=1 Tax=Trichonephila inaurata madagascariensis TaxID=2747483 RepID=A0A8X7CJN8_9ARAC|nr:hypothetical protein TNIN_31391 [Trichonephila inaurata madagascariensis]